eukprot:UN05497
MFFLMEPMHIADYLNFEIEQMSIDIFWFLFGSSIIIRYFWGGDFRTNKDILSNVLKLDDAILHLTVNLVLAQQSPYQDRVLRKRMEKN